MTPRTRVRATFTPLVCSVYGLGLLHENTPTPSRCSGCNRLAPQTPRQPHRRTEGFHQPAALRRRLMQMLREAGHHVTVRAPILCNTRSQHMYTQLL
jgi:hypothetical protein